MDDLINAAIQILAQIGGAISQGIGNAVNAVASYVQTLTYNIQNGLASWVTSIGNAISNLVNGVVSRIEGIIQPIVTWVQGLIAQVQSLVNGLIQQIEGVIGGILDGIVSAFSSVLDYLQTVASNIVSYVQSLVQSVVSTIEGWMQSVTGEITNLINSALDGLRSVWDSIVQSVSTALSYLNGVAGAILAQVVAVVQAAWQQLVTGAEAIIRSVNDRILGLRDAFHDAATTLGQSLSQLETKELSPLREAFQEYLGKFSDFLSDEDQRKALSALDVISDPHSVVLESRGDFQSMLPQLLPASGFGKTVVSWGFTLMAIGGFFAGVVQANGERVKQEYSMKYPWQTLPAGEATQAYHRGSYGFSEAVTELRKQGFTEPDAIAIIKNGWSVPDIGTLSAMRLRGIIDQGKWQQGVTAAGLDPEWQGFYAETLQVIPPISDLITMAVREVFTPDTVLKFGQNQEFPAPLATWAAKQGLSQEWAQNYWAMHWNLPSATQGFEMLHRGVISAEELDLLLKSLDVMPYWRDKLRQITFNQLTRVDIRRMHKLGLLDVDDLVKRYTAAGYTLDDAAKLAALTVELNKDKGKPADAELGRISRASVLRFLKDGLISEAEAVTLLVTLGETQQAAELYVAAAQVEDAANERRAHAEHIVAQVEAGQLTPEQAQTQLLQAGLSQTEVETYLTKLIRKLSVPTHKLSKDECTKLLGAGLMTADEFVEELVRGGYARRWATAFLTLSQRES